LENRLHQRLDVNGSLEYVLTWKHWDMLSGPPICALRASARRRPGKGYGGWPTAAARDWKSGKSNQHGKNARPLNEVAILAGYPKPRSVETGHTMGNPERAHDHKSRLEDMIYLAGYPTPGAADGSKAPDQYARGNPSLPGLMKLVGYRTPSSSDGEGGVVEIRKGKAGRYKLRDQIMQVSGAISTSSPSKTEKRGALNPAHSRWLMGFPPEWDDCAVTVTPSTLKRQRCSSGRVGK